jgi:molybdopterin-guanine dinucleotide biosynthesis protein B
MKLENVLFIVGNHESGKTTFIEKLIPAIKRDHDLTLGIVKDIHIEGFTIDQEGKDTWRLTQAGASIVCAKGLVETDFIIKHPMELEQILEKMDVDFVIAEGFKEISGVTKIIVSKDLKDYRSICATISAEDTVIAVAGPLLEEDGCPDTRLAVGDDESMDQLVGMLDPMIKSGKLRRNRLTMPFNSATCTLSVNCQDIPMKEFVAATLRNVIVGLVASLHWNVWEPFSTITVTLSRPVSDPGSQWNVQILLDEKELSLKEFVQAACAGAIAGFVGTLDMSEEAGFEMCGEIVVQISL